MIAFDIYDVPATQTTTVVADNTGPAVSATKSGDLDGPFTFVVQASDPTGIDVVGCGVGFAFPSPDLVTPPYIWTFYPPANSDGDTVWACWAWDTYGNFTETPLKPIMWSTR